MPKNEFYETLKPLGFTGAKKQLLIWAGEMGERLSVRHAKSIAGQVFDAADADDYKRIIHGDPVGEGVARRWMDFKHNLAVPA